MSEHNIKTLNMYNSGGALEYIQHNEIDPETEKWERLFNYVESVRNDAKYLNGCYRGEQLRVELNEKVGREWYVYDMYRLLGQLDKYLQYNDFGTDINKILEKYKQEELERNSIVYENNGSYSAIVLSRRGIVIQ